MAQTKVFVTLLQKNGVDANRTIYTDSVIPNTENNLADWLIRAEITNTGVSKVNTGSLKLRIDEKGTFVRASPILVDEQTKNNYLIEIQIKQDLNGDGDFTDANEQGIVLRGIIGSPTIMQSSAYGEILNINITSIAHHFKEQLTSDWHLFDTPKQSFQKRMDSSNEQVGIIKVDSSSVNNLPNTPQLNYRFSQPATIHDALGSIVDLISNPQVSGGAFDDYYFEMEPSATKTNHIKITADKFGDTDSGVVIDPLAVSVEDTDEENTTVVDNIGYKNHVIMYGGQSSGSLPVARSKFASYILHGRYRDTWSASSTYAINHLVKHKISATQSQYTGDKNLPDLLLYLKCLQDHSGGTVSDPLANSSLGTYWEIDFVEQAPFHTNSSAYYEVGEIVTKEHSTTKIGFFQCKESGTYANNYFNSATDSSVPSGWYHMKSILKADVASFFSYSPYTSDVDVWKQSLAGASASDKPSGYEGYALDWNMTRSNYNRKDMTNHFETVTPKVVTGRRWNGSGSGSGSVSTKEKFDGQRFLIDGNSSGMSTPSGEFAGKINRIAEWDATENNGSGGWVFSEEAVISDKVISIEDAKIYRMGGGNNWQVGWDNTNASDLDKPTPFHVVEGVGLVAGATGVSAQAVEFKYNWAEWGGAKPQNRTSRGVWVWNSFLLPRLTTNQHDIGNLWGGEGGGAKPPTGTLDTNNLDYDSNGQIGWNKGSSDEDYGVINSIAFKCRVGMFQDTEGTYIVEGVKEIPLTFWIIDKFDRCWYHKFKLRRNNQWDDVSIPIGEMARANMFFARWDELGELIDGVPLTQFDYTLKEKEYTGVKVDWKYMKFWGIQLDEAYIGGQVGLYKNGVERAWDHGEDQVSNLGNNWWNLFARPITQPLVALNILPRNTPFTANYIRFSAKIALDDFHFVKDLVATSSDTQLTNPRTVVENDGTEQDYLNLKTKAIAKATRKKFFPQTAHINCAGDVRLKFGHSFKVKGSRVPENVSNKTLYPDWSSSTSYSVGNNVSHGDYTYQALKAGSNKQPDSNADYWENLNKFTVSSVTHTFDHGGYRAEVAGFRKFVVSG